MRVSRRGTGFVTIDLTDARAVGARHRMLSQAMKRRSRERLPDDLWHATVRRVRAEFEEMPCLRVSTAQACTLFGLPDRVCEWVLGRLESDGFLGRTPAGEYVRQTTAP